MAIAEKLQNIINEKNDQATMTNYGLTSGNQINSSTKFIDYPKYIFNAFLEALRNPDTLFSNLPKKSGTGSVISLNDTANAPMRIELGSRTLEQETTTGKQLFNTKLMPNTFAGFSITVDDNGRWKFNGTSTTQEQLRLDMTNTDSKRLYANKIIYFDLGNGATPPMPNIFQLVIRNSNSTTKTYYSIPTNVSKGQWDLTNEDFNNGEYFEFFMYKPNSTLTLNNAEYSLMISDTPNVSYEPYTGGIASPNPSYPQDIHTISGSNKVKVFGENLFDENTYKSATYTTATYKYTQTDILANRTLYFKAQLKEGKTAISGLYLCLTTDGANPNNGLSAFSITNGTIVSSSTQYSKTFGNNTLYLSFYPTSTSVADIFDRYNLWVETSDTTYTPYTSQEADIDLGIDNLFKMIMTQTLNGVRLTYNGDGSYTLNGTAISSTNIALSSQSLSAGDYSLQCRFEGSLPNNSSPRIQVYSSAKNYNLNVPNNASSDSVANATLSSDATDISFRIRIDNGFTYNNVKIYPLLVKGTYTTLKSFSPYGIEPIEYCKIDTYEDKFIRTSGKNLFDGTTSATNKRLSTSGTGTYTQEGYSISNFIEVEPNATYTLTTGVQSYFCEYDENKTYITGTGWTSGGQITMRSDAKYIKFDFPTNANVMLNEGSTALDYEPYGSNEWYIKKNIGKKVFNGTESWQTQSNGAKYSHYVNVPDAVANQNSPVWCNIGVYNTSLWFVDNATYISSSGNLNYRDDAITSSSDFKTFLGTTNMIYYYILSTPEYIPITGTLAEQLENVYQKLLSYDNTTNISQINNDLAFEISASALEDIG